jgi:SAM-dependent methyltransferase
MPFLSSLTERRRQPEIMDQPDLDRQRHFGALRGLERINSWSGSARLLWPPIRSLARATSGRPLRVLDVATGAGDVPVRLWHKARRAGLRVQIDGCDRSAEAVAYARSRAAENRAEVGFFVHDALGEALPAGYDVLMSSLFLHHLDEEQAVAFLRRTAQAAAGLVLINDLVRSRAGFVLAWVGTRLLSRSAVVHTDGPRSVEGAFTIAEVRSLAEQAGLHGATVARRWPCRFLLTWRRL